MLFYYRNRRHGLDVQQKEEIKNIKVAEVPTVFRREAVPPPQTYLQYGMVL
jgi:hypothetical protein